MQETATELVSAPAWPRHLAAVRRTLQERRDALLGALRGTALSVERPPGGGMHLWARLPAGTDERLVAAAAARADVVVSPGRPWFATEPAGPYLRLTYAAEPPERLAAAAGRLAEVLGAYHS
jgi:DNA-binding transcriptional MocR family regulator